MCVDLHDLYIYIYIYENFQKDEHKIRKICIYVLTCIESRLLVDLSCVTDH